LKDLLGFDLHAPKKQLWVKRRKFATDESLARLLKSHLPSLSIPSFASEGFFRASFSHIVCASVQASRKMVEVSGLRKKKIYRLALDLWKDD
jgi:hypothetical protein